MHASTFHRLSKPIALAPAVLVAYAIFAVAVTVTDFAVLPFTSDDFREWLVPRTGWVPSMFYAFSIYFAFACVFQRERRASIRFTITGLLILQVVLGVWELTGIRNENYGNPYLTINPWRSIWTIVIPSIWVIAFYFPSMNRFCKKVTELEEA